MSSRTSSKNEALASLDFSRAELRGKQVWIPYREGRGALKINCNATDGGRVPVPTGQAVAHEIASVIYGGLKE